MRPICLAMKSFTFSLITASLFQAQDMGVLKTLKWRNIGPFRGGRVAAVAGVGSQPSTYYFGAVGGGVWKTSNSGAKWQCVTVDSPWELLRLEQSDSKTHGRLRVFGFIRAIRISSKLPR
jgi:hypothetical protein